MVISDGSRIATRQRQGSSVAALLSHEPPKPLRDHAKANVLAMRQKQRLIQENRIRKEMDEENDKNWKMAQFSGIASKVHDNKENASQGKFAPNRMELAPRQDNFLKKQTGRTVAHQAERGELAAAEELENDKYYRHTPEARPRVPSRSEISKRIADEKASNAPQRNFIRENRDHALQADMDANAFVREAEKLKQLYGKKSIRKDPGTNVPEYLTKIKNDLAQKKRDQSAAVAALKDAPPAGYKVLSEDERTETLAALKSKQQDLEEALQKLPLRINSDAHKNRERELQTKLKEMEDAITMFQRPRVLVKIDC